MIDAVAGQRFSGKAGIWKEDALRSWLHEWPRLCVFANMTQTVYIYIYLFIYSCILISYFPRFRRNHQNCKKWQSFSPEWWKALIDQWLANMAHHRWAWIYRHSESSHWWFHLWQCIGHSGACPRISLIGLSLLAAGGTMYTACTSQALESGFMNEQNESSQL